MAYGLVQLIILEILRVLCFEFQWNLHCAHVLQADSTNRCRKDLFMFRYICAYYCNDYVQGVQHDPALPDNVTYIANLYEIFPWIQYH